MSDQFEADLDEEVGFGLSQADDVLAGVTSTKPKSAARVKDEAAAEDLTKRMAATLVRRYTDQHGCRGEQCAHPDHRRDVDYMEHMLQALDLPLKFEPPTAMERKHFLAHLPNRIDVDLQLDGKMIAKKK